MSTAIIWRIERHELGPRVHVLGRRVHEYHLGAALVTPATAAAAVGGFSSWLAVVAALGAWLVVKDWPDLFPATRDTASWSWGIHRAPPPWRRGRDPVRSTG